MSTAVVVALIGGSALVIVTLIQSYSAKKAALDARAAAKEAKAGVDTVIHMVDGTQTSILDELKILTRKSAGLEGELRGRDYTREHMEARQDAVTASEKKAEGSTEIQE